MKGIMVTTPTTTQHSLIKVVELDMKMTVHTPPHHRNSAVGFKSLRLTFIDLN